MMQQPMYQQEQPGSQESGGQQQMVLCPVRLVYETQMLVQPGEQMQPNQTILINPQNPPPWIQNRPVQNQVIYVQHVPSNYVPSPQQHIDQNQLYIQNYGYHNVPQMMMSNQQEQIRPIQMMPQNIMQNFQANVGQNIQNQRMTNIGQMQNSINIVNPTQNHNQNMNRQIVSNQIVNMNELINNLKPQENLGQNIYRQQMPQSVQQQEPRIPMQQTFTMMPNSMQTVQRISQGPDLNNSQIRPPQQNVVTNIQQTYPNAIVNIQENRKNNTPYSRANNFNVVNATTIAKPQSQTYRPIQPRTAQIKSTVPNFLPIQPNVVQPILPNVVNMNNGPRKVMPSNTVGVSNNVILAPSSIKMDSANTPINRKRKSESPDEIHKKMPIMNHTANPITIKQIPHISNSINSADVGTSTSPVHKADGRITINSLQITPLNQVTSQNTKIKEELAKPVRSVPIIEPQNVVRHTNLTNNIELLTPTPPIQQAQNIPIVTNSMPVLSTDKDKLVRNTVYPQARGRVLTDKNTVQETVTVLPTLQTPNVTEVNTPKITNTTNIEKNCDKINDTKSMTLVESIKVENKIDAELKKPFLDRENEKTKDVKTEESKQDIKLKDDKDFILTHVLDGFVIQESNIAFPIRKPLKEKTLHINADAVEPKKEYKEEIKNNDAKTVLKNNSKILDISHLNIKDYEKTEKVEIEIKNEDDKENPFKLLNTSTIKSWTADNLAAHLSKYGWSETVSVLQEHEIDGESLLLVSKGQLLTIGVSEDHADRIAEFVKS